MSCARATTRDIRSWLAFSSVVLLGCARAIEMPSPNRANPLPPGVEPKGADFLRQIARFAPSNIPHDRERRAKCVLCSKIKVRIVGLGDTYTIDPHNPPSTGQPVAHLTNLHPTKIEKYYGLLPGAQADYYLWVDAKSPTQARWTLLELNHTTDSVYAAPPADLNYCVKYATPKNVSEADFTEYKHRSCNVELPDSPAKVTEASILTSQFVAVLKNAVAVLFLAAGGGGWISCSNGCCT